jgi:hypothetical protein
MANNHSFDRVYGKRAFHRLRSLLDDPGFAYQQIGNKFGLTRQRISQLANESGVDARQRQRERTLRGKPYIITKQYPPPIRAVIAKIRRSGMQVMPYISPQPYRPNVLWSRRPPRCLRLSQQPQN